MKQPRDDRGRYSIMISDEDVSDVFMLHGPHKMIANRYGISVSHVCKIKLGLVHRHVTALLCDPKVISATLTTLAIYPEAA